MTTEARTTGVNPELDPFIPMFPTPDLSDPVTARRHLAELARSAPPPDITDIEIVDRTVPAGPDVAIRIYRPRQAHGAIVWLHGGGFVMGDLETEHPWAIRIANGANAVVISVGYRRAPEHRFPAALDDSYAALTWAAEQAAQLDIESERIAIGGHAEAITYALRLPDRSS